MNDRKNDLKLDTLYPDMPPSFSHRIDDALNEVRSGRVRRRGRRHAVAVACACAAAFVVICGTALLLPALQQETRRGDSVICPLAPVEPADDKQLSEIETALLVQLQVAEGDRFVLTELSAVRQGREYVARAGYLLYHNGAVEPYAQERAEITLTETAEGLLVSRTQVLSHEALLPTPTPDPLQAEQPLPTPAGTPHDAPTSTPSQAIRDVEPTTTETDTVSFMARLRATQLLEEYYAALQTGQDAKAEVIAERNDDTALWYAGLELERALLDMGYAEPVEGDMLHDVRVADVASAAYGYVNAACEATTVFADGHSYTIRFSLTLDPQQDYRIVGIARQDETAMTAALEAGMVEYMAEGMTRAEASATALEVLCAQLRERVTVAWDGQAGELLWSGQRLRLPQRNRSGQAWQTAEGTMSGMALLESGKLPTLPLDVFVGLKADASSAIGGAVQPDRFVLWRDNGVALAKVCTGTPGTLAAQLADLPAGPYLVTFSFWPDLPAAETAETSPVQEETSSSQAVPVTSEVQFAFAVLP